MEVIRVQVRKDVGKFAVEVIRARGSWLVRQDYECIHTRTLPFSLVERDVPQTPFSRASMPTWPFPACLKPRVHIPALSKI